MTRTGLTRWLARGCCSGDWWRTRTRKEKHPGKALGPVSIGAAVNARCEVAEEIDDDLSLYTYVLQPAGSNAKNNVAESPLLRACGSSGVSKDKGGRAAKKPKAAKNIKVSGQTPVAGSGLVNARTAKGKK